MPVKVSTGLAKKVGQPDFGSLCASCNVEFEIDPSLLTGDLQAFHQRVRSVYAACEQSVQEQLDRSQSHATQRNGSATPLNNAAHSRSTQSAPPSSTNGSSPNGSFRKATQSQIRAIIAIANRRTLDLNSMLRDRFAVNDIAALSIADASSLIDDLKSSAQAKGGRG